MKKVIETRDELNARVVELTPTARKVYDWIVAQKKSADDYVYIEAIDVADGTGIDIKVVRAIVTNLYVDGLIEVVEDEANFRIHHVIYATAWSFGFDPEPTPAPTPDPEPTDEPTPAAGREAEREVKTERAANESAGIDPLVDDDARDLAETMIELGDLLIAENLTPFQKARIRRLTAIRDRKAHELTIERVRLCREAGFDPDGADDNDRYLTVAELERKLAGIAATANDDDLYDCARRDRLRDLINEKRDAAAACIERGIEPPDPSAVDRPDLSRAEVKAILDDLYENNAFGNLADYDPEDIGGEAKRLLQHWNEQGWAIGVGRADVVMYIHKLIDSYREYLTSKAPDAPISKVDNSGRDTVVGTTRKAPRVRKADAALPDYRAAVARVISSDKFAGRLREIAPLSGSKYVDLVIGIVNAVMIDLRRNFAARTLDQQVAAIEVDKALHGARETPAPAAVRPKLERVEIDHTGDFMTVRLYWNEKEYGLTYGETLHIVGFMSRDLFAIAGDVPRVYHTPTFEDNTGLLRIDVDLAFRSGDPADEQDRRERREKAAAVVMVSVRMYETVFNVQAGQVRVV